MKSSLAQPAGTGNRRHGAGLTSAARFQPPTGFFSRLGRSAGSALAAGLVLGMTPWAAGTPSSWLTATSGLWETGANWSTAPFVPNNGNNATTYDALIGATGSAYTVSLGSDITLDTFVLNSADATFSQTGGEFRVLGAATLTAGTYLMNAGLGGGESAIIGGTFNVGAGASLKFDLGFNRLVGTTLNGDLNLTEAGGSVVLLQSGTTFSGNATLGSPGSALLIYDQTGTLDNQTINFGESSFLSVEADHTLTLGAGLIARGGGGGIGGGVLAPGSPTLINHGLISADVSGSTLGAGGSTFTNHGIAEAKNGATLEIGATTWTNAATGTLRALAGSTLNLSGAYTNAGAISVVNGTLNLGGSFTLGTLTRTGGVINVTGALQNTAGTLALNATTGDFNLPNGGSIVGGTITQSGGASLRLLGGAFDGAVLTGDLDLATIPAAAVILRNGGGFTGNAALGTATTFGGTIIYSQSGTLDNRTISLASMPSQNGFTQSTLRIVSGETLTLGPGLVAHGNGRIGENGLGDTLINQGLISADVSGRLLTILSGSFTNQGIVEAIDGGEVDINTTQLVLTQIPWSNAPGATLRASDGSTLTLGGSYTNSGTIAVSDSTLNLGGEVTTAQLGTINRTGGTVYLTGELDNTNATLALNAVSGDWTMNVGRILGGTVTQSGGARLLYATLADNWLVGTTLVGDLYLTNANGNQVTLKNGATFTGDAHIGPVTVALAPQHAVLLFDQSGTLDDKTLFFAEATREARLTLTNNRTLTFGPNLVARGAGEIAGPVGQFGSSSLENNGLISADTAGKTLTIGTEDFANDGIAEARNGGTLELRSPITTNAGTIRALGGSTVHITSANGLSSTGIIRLEGGLLKAAAGITVGLNGSLVGDGEIEGDVFITGLLSPGSSIGAIEVTGDYTQAFGEIVFELASTSGMASNDLLETTGGGISLSDTTLHFALLPGSEPLLVGQTFTVMQVLDPDDLTTSDVTTFFDPSLASYTFTTTQTASSYAVTVATVVPEPSSALLLLGGTALLGLRRRRAAVRKQNPGTCSISHRV